MLPWRFALPPASALFNHNPFAFANVPPLPSVFLLLLLPLGFCLRCCL
ncbi:hypothetical protein [Methanimicrococcus hongohii]|nr:hypothetical protein [Methanimicrococcus sp. Hf6]